MDLKHNGANVSYLHLYGKTEQEGIKKWTAKASYEVACFLLINWTTTEITCNLLSTCLQR